MDEGEIPAEATIPSIRHDRWSVLILGLTTGQRILEALLESASKATEVACQHANYMMEKDKFREMARTWRDDG